MISKFSRVTTLIGFLLVNILVASCICGKSPEEKEKKELVKQKKELMDNLQKHFKPEHWKKIEEEIKKEKNGLTQVDESIEESKRILEVLGKLEKGNAINLEMPEIFPQLFLSLKGIDLTLTPNLLQLKKAEIQKELQKILTNKANIAKAKQATMAGISLYENFKKQLGLKNKGKKLKIIKHQNKNS